MPPSDIFQTLKDDTADIHLRIEQRVPVFHEGFSLADYARLLGSFYGFWAPLEARLSQLPDLRDAGLELTTRLKSSLLEDDLRFLGHDPAAVRRCGDLPAVDTTLRGLGCLYVLEGSTLGARFIAQRVDNDLRLRAGSGASFFNAYGESTGRRWKEFKSFVVARVSVGESEEIVTAARGTFQCFFNWLDVKSV